LNEGTPKFGRRFLEKMTCMPSFDRAAGTCVANTVMVRLRRARLNVMFVKTCPLVER
jgi:hypothetical protein